MKTVDMKTFSESITSKVHKGLWKRTKGNALAILSRYRGTCCGRGLELSQSDIFELEQISKGF